MWSDYVTQYSNKGYYQIQIKTKLHANLHRTKTNVGTVQYLLHTFDIKIPNPRSYPPRIEKWRISSLEGRVRVTVLALAFVAQAKSSSLSCPAIFSLSSPSSNCSRKFIMTGSISKSVKWLFTQSNTTRVTLSLREGSSNLLRKCYFFFFFATGDIPNEYNYIQYELPCSSIK